jgi:hypothetical protein
MGATSKYDVSWNDEVAAIVAQITEFGNRPLLSSGSSHMTGATILEAIDQTDPDGRLRRSLEALTRLGWHL